MLHELGHYLIRESEQATDWIFNHDDPARLEEELANAIAAVLLLPDEVVDNLLAGGHPSAESVNQLYLQSEASLQVCVIALARRLGCEGFIALTDARTNTVVFASRNADTRPYAWRDDPVPSEHLLRQLASGESLHDRSWWPWPNGDRDEYYMDAKRHKDQIVAVFAKQNWFGVPGLSILETRDDAWADRRPVSKRFWCQSCRAERSSRGFDCSDCETPFCATCGRCNCERIADDRTEVCTKCRVRWSRNLVKGGLCKDCRPPEPPPAYPRR